MNINEFIASQNIKMTANVARCNPSMADDEWARTASHYKCEFRRNGKRLTTYFSMGIAHTKQPTAAEVLDCLASDASTYINARGFEDWCTDYGYDSDSRKAEKIYKTIKRQSQKLQRFLTDAQYTVLLSDIERL